jgi:hypothetical protein
VSTMPFGRFRGVPLDELPDQYFEWLLTIALREPLRAAVAHEARRRGAIADPRGWQPQRDVVDEIISAGVKTLARHHHPDVGGDHESMRDINAAADWLRATVRGLAA